MSVFRQRRARRPNLVRLEDRLAPAVFAVTNLLDGTVSKAGDLPGSLRQAIFDANALAGADVVDAKGVGGTIALTKGELTITGSLTVEGPGSSKLTIDGQGKSRILNRPWDVNYSPQELVVISGLTVTGGSASNGAGINSAVRLNLHDVVVAKNLGGGVSGEYDASTVTITNSLITGNSGGAVAVPRALFIQNSTITGNTSSSRGGISATTVTLTNCQIANNSASFLGGAVYASVALLTDCTLSQNSAASGGGVFANYAATLTNCDINNNRANSGGAIYSALTNIVNSRLTNNTAEGGGAIYLSGSFSSSAIDRTLFRANKASQGGAISMLQAGALYISSSTFDSNVAVSSYTNLAVGGAIAGNIGIAQFDHCTFSQNMAAGQGGALSLSLNGPSSRLTLSHCTLSDNEAWTSGGAVDCRFPDGQVVIRNTIIADNSAASAPDISSPGRVAFDHAAVGSLQGIRDYSRTGFLLVGPAHLLPLANNGGPTETMLPGPGSPVRDAGVVVDGASFDQRGSGFPRLIGVAPDIGAVESTDKSPTAAVLASDVDSSMTGDYLFNVRYSSSYPWQMNLIVGNSNAVKVVNSTGAALPVQYVGIDDASAGTVRTAIYKVTAPAGQFAQPDNGRYSITLGTLPPRDVVQKSPSVSSLSAFSVNIPARLTVTNTLDGPVSKAGDLPGSLRQAVFDANQSTAQDTIAFDPTAFSAGSTIFLSSGHLTISDTLVVDGLGASLVRISGNYSSSVFRVQSSSPSPMVFQMSGIAIADAKTTSIGGGVFAQNVDLTIADCVFDGNSGGSGGGLHVQASNLEIRRTRFFKNAAVNGRGGGMLVSASGAVSLFDCDFSENTAAAGGGLWAQNCPDLTMEQCRVNDNVLSGTISGTPDYKSAAGVGVSAHTYYFNSSSSTPPLRKFTIRDSEITGNSGGTMGGGLYLRYGVTASVERTAISKNSTGWYGGGILLDKRSNLVLDASTIAGNSAGTIGGGLALWGGDSSVTFVVRNSTISSNSAGMEGGAIDLFTSGSVRIDNSTIVDNTAAKTGGGFNHYFGSATINSTIIARNASPDSPDWASYKRAATVDHSFIGIAPTSTNITYTATLTGTAAFPLDPLLGPLADNGGPTLTHALLPGSPAINAGSNTAGLLTDQIGQTRVVGGSADMGAYELPQRPVVASVAINGGAAQRSQVTHLAVVFDQRVTLPLGNPASAFQLVRSSDGAAVQLAAAVVEGATTTVTLTFVGGAVDGASLADGRYTLIVFGGLVATAAGAMTSDYRLEGNPANGLFRLYGDADGDGFVDNVDLVAFRAAMQNGGPSYFDADGNGFVDLQDFNRFRQRLGSAA